MVLSEEEDGSQIYVSKWCQLGVLQFPPNEWRIATSGSMRKRACDQLFGSFFLRHAILRGPTSSASCSPSSFSSWVALLPHSPPVLYCFFPPPYHWTCSKAREQFAIRRACPPQVKLCAALSSRRCRRSDYLRSSTGLECCQW